MASLTDLAGWALGRGLAAASLEGSVSSTAVEALLPQNESRAHRLLRPGLRSDTITWPQSVGQSKTEGHP